MPAVIAPLHPDVALRIGAYQGLERVHRTLDDAALQLTAARQAPLCVEACGLCCERNTPAVSQLEAEYLFSSLTRLGGEARRAVIEACWDWLVERRPDIRHYGATYDGRSFTAEQRQEIQEEGERLLRGPCPFFGEVERRCRIYAMRPVACRAYSVTLAPAVYCQRPQTAHETDEVRLGWVGRGTVNDLVKHVVELKRYLQKKHPDGMIFGFLPFRFLCCIDPGRVERHIRNGEVATAKLGAGRGFLPWKFWQNQPVLDIAEV